MKSSFMRVIAAGSLLASVASISLAEDYQCRDSAGCAATRTKRGTTQVVVFRRGDLISTEAGWTVDPNDGWVKVHSGFGFGGGPGR